jgi:hypothetical protein
MKGLDMTSRDPNPFHWVHTVFLVFLQAGLPFLGQQRAFTVPRPWVEERLLARLVGFVLSMVGNDISLENAGCSWFDAHLCGWPRCMWMSDPQNFFVESRCAAMQKPNCMQNSWFIRLWIVFGTSPLLDWDRIESYWIILRRTAMERDAA